MHIEVVKYKLAKLIDDYGHEQDIELDRSSGQLVIEMDDGTEAIVVVKPASGEGE